MPRQESVLLLEEQSFLFRQDFFDIIRYKKLTFMYPWIKHGGRFPLFHRSVKVKLTDSKNV